MNLRKNLGVELILIILVATFENVVSYPDFRPRGQRYEKKADKLDAGDPLFLTPLLEAGQAESARSQAKVTHPEMMNIESYAGYFTVNKLSNSNLFFWYFPAKENPVNAPVVLYLEGGPGVTSLFSLFFQNGPLMLSSENVLEQRKESWNNKHNLIYIDSPVGTGYSFTDWDGALPTTQIQIGDELRIAMQQFFQLFPSLRKNDFFVTGESYAGKFAPAVSYAIHLYNADVTEDKKINLKGMAISNGYTDPINQLIYGEYLYKIGLIDANGRDQFLALEKEIQELVQQHQHTAAYDVAMKLMLGSNTLFKNLTGYETNHNILKIKEEVDYALSSAWVQRDDVRRAIHVGDTPFTPVAEKVANNLKDDLTQSQANLVAALLDHYRVLIYTGHLDIICSYSSVQNYLQKLPWSGAEEFKIAKRQQWRVASGELAGYIKKAGKLNEVLLREAGHLTSLEQPQWTLELLEKFTKGSL